ncbi:MAG: hypothetical protein IJD36_06795 [Clostridia bacterium]|nr:hypothetical protein [Clostridia bacterium]
MSEVIIVAIITGAASLLGTYFASRAAHNKVQALLEFRLNILEEKQDKYNNVIARQYDVETRVGVLENREKVSEHRIEDLEKKVG